MNKELKDWLDKMLTVYQNNLKVRHFIRNKLMVQNFKNAGEASNWLLQASEDDKLSDEVIAFIEIALLKVDSDL